MYLPAQPENRAPFYRDCLGPFLGTLPTLSNVMVMGDMNVVEDPALDKSSGVGSSAENRRLLSYWAGRPLTDAFRYLHPGKREYTFHMKAKGVSTRIDRALVSQPLLCKLVDVRHADITNKMTDHWSAVVVALESSAAIEKGPGIWRLRAVQAKKRGVRRRVEKVIMDAGGDLGGMLPRLSACLRAYTKEERKRIGATMKHLEKEVRVFRQRLSQNPQCQRTGAILLKKEELLNAYEKSHQEKLQEWLGLKAELDGEATTGFLSGKIKERKARTEVKSVCYNGTTHSGAREVLTAATEYFRNSFGGGDTDSHGTEPQVMDRVLCDASRRALGAPWSEEEVRAAVRELAPGKSPGQDGLPKELNRWEAEREQLAFNRRIPFRGASPFGNQQGSAKLLGVTLGDLVWRRADGSRELKCVETLTSELGSVDTAKLALKAFMAAPAGWRDMILATLTSEELVAKVPLLRYQGCISAAPSLWKVSGAVSGRVTGVACRESKDGTFTVGDGKYPVNFGLHSGEPVAAQGDKPKKVIRLAVVKFVAHARVYCLARQMAARKHGVVVGADNWDYLATDEAAVMRRICSKGAPLTWRNNFSSIWNDPKMTNRPP
ncbi:unnamed protein product [Closterium sp. NIES-64]|nr:unnamed protein product [Closterium sp. NIES-64]